MDGKRNVRRGCGGHGAEEALDCETDLERWLEGVASLLVRTAAATGRPAGMELLLEILDARAGGRRLDSEHVRRIIGHVEGAGASFDMGRFQLDAASALRRDGRVFTDGSWTGRGPEVCEAAFRRGENLTRRPCRVEANGDIVPVDRHCFSDGPGSEWTCLGTFEEYVADLLRERSAETGYPVGRTLLTEILFELDEGDWSSCFDDVSLEDLDRRQVAAILRLARDGRPGGEGDVEACDGDDGDEDGAEDEDLEIWLEYVASRVLEEAAETGRPADMELLLEVLDGEAGDCELTSGDLARIVEIIEDMGEDFDMDGYELDEAAALERRSLVYTDGRHVGRGPDILKKALRGGADACRCPCRVTGRGDIVFVERPWLPGACGSGWNCLGTFEEYVAGLLRKRAARTGRPADEGLLKEVLDGLDGGDERLCFIGVGMDRMRRKAVAQILKLARRPGKQGRR